MMKNTCEATKELSINTIYSISNKKLAFYE